VKETGMKQKLQLLALLTLLFACGKKELPPPNPLFESIQPSESGITFSK